MVNVNAQADLTPEKSLSTHSTGSRVGHRAAMDGHEGGNLFTLTEVRTSTVQPVASRNPEYAVPAPLTTVHIKHRVVKLLIM